ncbi:MAG: HlyD family efflux transporter periplasmic adaptor subunit [Gammaproteobacteria bacterium]|nr:HlyD family efflux transporter periplasmic adaptor subunit [Gammaproteobacteria bacterium]
MPATRMCSLLVLGALLAACARQGDAGFAGYIEGEYLYLAAPQAGYLEALLAPRGSRVDLQQPVFTVSADPDRQALQEAEARARAAQERLRNLDAPRRASEIAAMEAQLRAAEAALELSSTLLRQKESLAAGSFISVAQLDEARATRDRDAAQVTVAREQLATYRASLGRTAERRGAEADVTAAAALVAQRRWQVERKAVTAPAAGEIADTYYRPGEWVPAGAAVASLLPDERRRLRFFVPETVVAAVAPGRAVEARCDGCAVPIRAVVDFVAPRAEYTPPMIYSRGSREKLVFRVEAVPAPGQAATLRPGLPVDVRLLER